MSGMAQRAYLWAGSAVRELDVSSPFTTPAPVEVGGVVVDRAYRLAAVDEVPMELTYLEFELLAHLVEHPRRVFTRVQLLDHVWGYEGTQSFPGGGRTVDVHVARLRRKLGRDRRQQLQTVRKVGYRFVADPR